MIRITYEVVVEFDEDLDESFDKTDAEAILCDMEELVAKKNLDLYSASVEWEDS